MLGTVTNPFARVSIWSGLVVVLFSMVRAFQSPGWMSTLLFYLVFLLAMASIVSGVVGMRASKTANDSDYYGSLIGLTIGGTIVLSNYARWIWTFSSGIFR